MTNCSLFGQILQIFPRHKFSKIVLETKAEYKSKGFSSWDQFVAMLFCQMAGCKSLREITDGLQAVFGKLNHLGMNESPARSTLSYANAHRKAELFEKVFYELLALCRAHQPGLKKQFKFKNKLLSLDASMIELCLSLFPWAEYRQTKGAVKLHLLLDHDGYLPIFASITEGRQHEVNIARTLSLPKGSIVAIDRGYTDYGLFYKWTKEKVFFVSRQKNNANFTVVEEKSISKDGSRIIADQIIRMEGSKTEKLYPDNLRRVILLDEKGKTVVFITNNFTLSSEVIAAIYKDRWEIELFFKEIKQNLKVKTFVGTSKNALLTQIWTALIAVLLVRYMRFMSKCHLSLSRLVALLRLNLFSYRDLWAFLSDPLCTPPYEPPDEQLALDLG
ncbi:MAG: IS4 family transposase [bacterium]|jgi:hypothetical protein